MSDQIDTSGVRPGAPFPLGPTIVGSGTNFAVYSEHATRIDVCLFEDGLDSPSRTLTLTDQTNFVWHGWIDGVQHGTRYGIRAHGPYDPAQGLRFNPAKLLVDPYARSIEGKVEWGPAVFGYDFESPEDELEPSDSPDDASMPKCVVIDGRFDWGDDQLPRTAWTDTVVYEAHVKGLSQLHPDVPEELRGTYLGAAHPAITDYLRSIGVTAIELLPVHSHVDDAFLVDKGLTNYWGYSTLNFFSPHAEYGRGEAGEEVNQFKEMVKGFHAAGIEVLLDVVYNHTCEGNHLGPALSFRGLDNTTYYHLLPGKPEFYLDFTGTGNALRASHPQVIALILDSLRYWVTEMHVDGFRFDLASTLGRDEYDFSAWSGLFDAMHQDPIISQVKLIAEPWDIGEGGYQVGSFPIAWSEWNDKFRDATRAFWLADSQDLAEMGYRFTGSSDIYEPSGRGPRSSINLITAHDGFTLNDLVSYAEKHNEANGEDGNDGHDHNLSVNYGIEGPTDDPAILDVRLRQQRNLLATLMFSQGVPMLLGGDEFGRTQQGNNNAYCQDNEISWIDWDLDENQKQLQEFVARLTEIRREDPILRRRRYFKGRPAAPDSFDDISWIKPDGNRMSHDDWTAPGMTIGMRLASDRLEEKDAEGNSMIGATRMIIVHAGAEEIPFVLPDVNREDEVRTWELALTTDSPTGEASARYHEGSEITVPSRTIMLFTAREDTVTESA
jgi:glycogen operon protein